MPCRPREIIITDAEKTEAVRRMTADLKAWRERNPGAPRGLPVRK